MFSLVWEVRRSFVCLFAVTLSVHASAELLILDPKNPLHGVAARQGDTTEVRNAHRYANPYGVLYSGDNLVTGRAVDAREILETNPFLDAKVPLYYVTPSIYGPEAFDAPGARNVFTQEPNGVSAGSLVPVTSSLIDSYESYSHGFWNH